DARLVDVRHVRLDLVDEVAELLGNRVANGIRNVDGRGAGVDAFRQHAVDVLEFGASGVHRRELDVVAVFLGAGNHRARHLEHSLLVPLELVHDVDIRTCGDGVDTPVLGVLNGLPAGVAVYM